MNKNVKINRNYSQNPIKTRRKKQALLIAFETNV